MKRKYITARSPFELLKMTRRVLLAYEKEHLQPTIPTRRSLACAGFCDGIPTPVLEALKEEGIDGIDFLEWAKSASVQEGAYETCEECNRIAALGHDDDCPLGIALKLTKEVKRE